MLFTHAVGSVFLDLTICDLSSPRPKLGVIGGQGLPPKRNAGRCQADSELATMAMDHAHVEMLCLHLHNSLYPSRCPSRIRRRHRSISGSSLRAMQDMLLKMLNTEPKLRTVGLFFSLLEMTSLVASWSLDGGLQDMM